MVLLDRLIYKGILRITTRILQNNFFYDEGSLARFLQIFDATMKEEYLQFDLAADSKFKWQLKIDKYLRHDFTSWFVSYHLHDILVDDLFFTEEELDAFENILPKYQGVQNDSKQINKRAQY